jgi:ADP-ribose 1''-phosphate phosphatase
MEENIELIEQKGSLFDAPAGAILLHACNCVGSWGAGVALGFKNRYPLAHCEYLMLCRDARPDDIVGTTALFREGCGKDHIIGCLFTSRGYGRNKDSKQQIVEATKKCFIDLLDKISKSDHFKNRQIWMCKINSGLFGVPWKETKEVIESIIINSADMPMIKVISFD